MGILISYDEGADNQAPGQVTGLALSSKSDSTISVLWNAASDNIAVVGYRVFVDGNPTTVGNVTTFSATSLNPQTQYDFTVQAFDAAGNYGALSSVLSVTTSEAATDEAVLMLYGDVSSNGNIPSGGSPYHQMRINETDNDGFSRFGNAINALQGVSISEMYDEDFLPSRDLVGVKVLFLASSQRVWTAGELSEIDTWVRNGGSLIVFSDSALGGAFFNVGAQNTVGQSARNPLLELYGMQFHVDQSEGVQDYVLAAGSVFGNVSSLSWRTEGSSPIRIDSSAGATEGNPTSIVSYSGTPSHTQNVTYTGDISALAVANPGNGFVVAISDRNLFFNEKIGTSIQEVDNQEFLETVFSYSANYSSSPISYNQTSGFWDYTTKNGNTYPVTDFTYAGIPGGIPDYSGAAETVVQSGTGNDLQAITDAISSAVSGRANDTVPVLVTIPDGTWNLSNGFNISDSRVKIRGESRAGTILEFATSSDRSGLTFLGSLDGGRVTANVNHTANTREITLPSGHSFSVGDFIHMELDGLPANFLQAFEPQNYSGEFDGEFYRNTVEILAINGSIATISTPLRVNVNASTQDLELNPCTIIEGSGIENLTMSWPSQISAGTSPGIRFQGAAYCWVQDVDLLTPPSSPFWGTRPGATQCSILNCYANEPHNTGGGGNGYAGFLGMHDCLMDQCTFDRPRHGPNLQGYCQGNVIRRSTFNHTNGEMHADFAGAYLIEQCTLFKGDKGNHDVWQTKFLHNTTDNHDPGAGYEILWNNFINGENGGGGGIRLGGLNINAIYAFNKIICDGVGGWIRKPNHIEIFDLCDGLLLEGNVSQSITATDALRFVPAFEVGGIGQTGIGNWDKYPDGTTERYAEPNPGNSQPQTQNATIHAEDNTFFGVTTGEEITGFNTLSTDINNVYNTGQPSGSLPDTTPPFASMYEEQMRIKAIDPSPWD